MYLPAIVVPPIVFAVVPPAQLLAQAYVFGSVLEFSCVGVLAVVFALVARDRRETFGLNRRGLPMSLLFGGGLVLLQATLRYALGEAPFGVTLLEMAQSLAQPFPANVGFALFTALAYGPLEVFYIVFLVVRADQGLRPSRRKILSNGTLLGVGLWASVHVTNAVFVGLVAGLERVVEAFVVGLVLMAIFKYTTCSVGPMVYWTVSNLFL